MSDLKIKSRIRKTSKPLELRASEIIHLVYDATHQIEALASECEGSGHGQLHNTRQCLSDIERHSKRAIQLLESLMDLEQVPSIDGEDSP